MVYLTDIATDIFATSIRAWKSKRDWDDDLNSHVHMFSIIQAYYNMRHFAL